LAFSCGSVIWLPIWRTISAATSDCSVRTPRRCTAPRATWKFSTGTVVGYGVGNGDGARRQQGIGLDQLGRGFDMAVGIASTLSVI